MNNNGFDVNAIPQHDSGGGASAIIFAVIYLGIMVFMIASLWKMFVKAGQPGWAAIVPIYNLIVLVKVAQRPMWYLALVLIPFVGGLVFSILLSLGIAKSFGKSGGFAAGLIFLPFVFYPMLGFGSATWQAETGAVGMQRAA